MISMVFPTLNYSKIQTVLSNNPYTLPTTEDLVNQN